MSESPTDPLQSAPTDQSQCAPTNQSKGVPTDQPRSTPAGQAKTPPTVQPQKNPPPPQSTPSILDHFISHATHSQQRARLSQTLLAHQRKEAHARAVTLATQLPSPPTHTERIELLAENLALERAVDDLDRMVVNVGMKVRRVEGENELLRRGLSVERENRFLQCVCPAFFGQGAGVGQEWERKSRDGLEMPVIPFRGGRVVHMDGDQEQQRAKPMPSSRDPAPSTTSTTISERKYLTRNRHFLSCYKWLRHLMLQLIILYEEGEGQPRDNDDIDIGRSLGRKTNLGPDLKSTSFGLGQKTDNNHAHRGEEDDVDHDGWFRDGEDGEEEEEEEEGEEGEEGEEEITHRSQQTRTHHRLPNLDLNQITGELSNSHEDEDEDHERGRGCGHQNNRCKNNNNDKPGLTTLAELNEFYYPCPFPAPSSAPSSSNSNQKQKHAEERVQQLGDALSASESESARHGKDIFKRACEKLDRAFAEGLVEDKGFRDMAVLLDRDDMDDVVDPRIFE